MLSILSSFEQMFISRYEYDESGPEIVHLCESRSVDYAAST